MKLGELNRAIEWNRRNRRYVDACLLIILSGLGVFQAVLSPGALSGRWGVGRFCGTLEVISAYPITLTFQCDVICVNPSERKPAYCSFELSGSRRVWGHLNVLPGGEVSGIAGGRFHLRLDVPYVFSLLTGIAMLLLLRKLARRQRGFPVEARIMGARIMGHDPNCGSGSRGE